MPSLGFRVLVVLPTYCQWEHWSCDKEEVSLSGEISKTLSRSINRRPAQFCLNNVLLTSYFELGNFNYLFSLISSMQTMGWVWVKHQIILVFDHTFIYLCFPKYFMVMWYLTILHRYTNTKIMGSISIVFSFYISDFFLQFYEKKCSSLLWLYLLQFYPWTIK